MAFVSNRLWMVVSPGGLKRLGKGFAPAIPAATSVTGTSFSCSSFRTNRAVHSSVYDKNEDENIRPHLVPSEYLGHNQPTKTWLPHPKSGVFVPEEEAVVQNSHQNSVSEGEGSVMDIEEKVWYRPLEGVERQPYN
eukprot:TRINITY_DN285_c0_g1_i2.p1 TRINITY_DN285_c0_g1~~TRINITY_DN285_c0_g1_i2.p1  ORF type:complete len:136 (-),score=20.50 TRINITY_DN285_c0_g1_i2:208-615(-)